MTSTTSHSKRTERRPRKGTVMATQLKKLLCSLLALTLSATSISVAAGTTVRYVHTDALGTPIAVTDESGNVIERSEYEPYGALLNRQIETEPGYTGHVQDAATGLTYMQQRYYDPQIGMFLSVDPVTAYEQPVGQFNRYRYANGNPYRFTDPDGRYIESAIDAASLAVGVTSLAGNISDGNFGAAAVDVVGLAVDSVALAVPLVPGGAGLGIKAVRAADAAASSTSAVKLEKQLASEEQLGTVMSGNGEKIAGNGTTRELRDAPRLAAEHGGEAADYAKVKSGSHTASDGSKVETHAYQNTKTGEVVEPKTKIIDEGK